MSLVQNAHPANLHVLSVLAKLNV